MGNENEILDEIKKLNKKIIILVLIAIIEIFFIISLNNPINSNEYSHGPLAPIRESDVFNSKFTSFEGKQYENGIISLLNEIEKNNNENKDRFIEIRGNYTKTSDIKPDIYYVDFDSDEDGYINAVIICKYKEYIENTTVNE